MPQINPNRFLKKSSNNHKKTGKGKQREQKGKTKTGDLRANLLGLITMLRFWPRWKHK